MDTAKILLPPEMKALKRKIAIRLFSLPLFFGLCILLPAGTFDFWQVYIYLAILCLPMLFVVAYFLKINPGFLERRMKMKEHEAPQKKIVFVTSIAYLAGFVIPGFDHRFGWSHVPDIMVLAADVLVLLSYIFIFYVFKENSYASRIIEVAEDQRVVTTGPYSIVRHPMYLGILVMYLATPVALASYWALIPWAFVPFSLVFRIRNEEKVLSEQLAGYSEYCKKVRVRMIPYIW